VDEESVPVTRAFLVTMMNSLATGNGQIYGGLPYQWTDAPRVALEDSRLGGFHLPVVWEVVKAKFPHGLKLVHRVNVQRQAGGADGC